MYRPEIKVYDCTIRDGGLMNSSKFSLETVRNVYNACCESGVDVIELGYRNSKKMFSPDEYGDWRFCSDENLFKVIDGIDSNGAKIAVMQDAHKAFEEDVFNKSDSPVDIIRIATYVKDVDKAIKLANSASKKGYDTTINIMAVSTANEQELDEALVQIAKETDVSVCYIVDSYGALYSEKIDHYVDKFADKMGDIKKVGIHCHNQQQLAFANTISAIIKGVNHLDSALYGFGRAAGNAPTELLIGFLKNPKFQVRPLLNVIGKEIIPLHEQMKWGYSIPYMICGILNRHPQAAMDLMKLPENDKASYDFAAFYDKMAREDF
ncbi:MAG: aldolase catalytic domain-containing protein [Chitinispirillales bacterium]|jgi:4-hydroxy 2-oxovalerate aldolase|nr:aldolase catalytic domain-containing protein [Chitinispirillales bacterium]